MIEFKAPEPTSYDECEDAVVDFVGDVSIGEDELSFLDAMGSKTWKDRQDAVAALTAKVEEVEGEVSDLTNQIVYFVYNKPSLKESNAMVLQNVVSLFGALAKHSESFEQEHANLIIPVIVNKLSDRKVVSVAPETLSNIAAAVGPHFAIGLVVDNLKGVKSPAAQAKGIEWIASCITEFGLGTVPAPALIGTTHKWLAAMNPQVKKAATAILVSIYKQTGDVLKEKMLDGLKPALAKAIESEFDSIPQDEIGVAPERAVKGQEIAAPVALDDLVPRTDISKMINDKMLAKLSDSNWKTRKEMLDAVEEILNEASHRIGPSDGGVMSELKGRLSDANKNLIRQTLELITMIVNDMGPPVKQYGRYVLSGVLINFSDAKKPIVAASATCLRAWLEVAGFASVIKYLPKGLKNPKGRAELLPVLADALDNEKEKLDLHELVGPVLSCMQDKIAAVRNAGERVLKHIMKAVGFHVVNSEVSSMKKAAQLQLKSVMDKLREEVEDEASAARRSRSKSKEPPASARSRSKSRPRTPARDRSRSRSRPRKPISRKSSKKKKARDPSPSSEEESDSPSPRPKSARGRRKDLGRSGTAASFKKSSSKAAFMDDDEEEIMVPSDRRVMEKRMSRDAKRLQGSFRPLSKDETDDLKVACESIFSSKLHKLMFSKDFAHYVKGLDMILSSLDDVFDIVMSNLDLLLKWCGWRVADANTSVLLKALEFLEVVFTRMENDEMQLEEAHVLNIVPALINLVLGHGKVQFRNSCHTILRLSVELYTPTSVYAMLVAGMKSKNKRTVSESIDEMGHMMQTIGLSKCKAERSLAMIASNVGNSDNGIRTAALGALQKVYQMKGDDIWKYLGGKDGRGKNPLPQKQRDLIMERFKRTKVTGEPDRDERPSHGGSPQRPQTAATPSRLPAPGGGSAIPRPGTASSRPRSKEQQSRGRQTPPKKNTPPAANMRAAAEYVNSSMSMSGMDPNVAAVFDLDFESIGREVGLEPQGSSAPPMDYSLPTSLPSSVASHHHGSSGMSDSNTGIYDSSIPAPSRGGILSPSSGSGVMSASVPVPSGQNTDIYTHLIKIEKSSTENDRIQAMRAIWQMIKKDGPHVVRPNTDKLIVILVNQIRLAFKPHERGEGLRLRLCKYALNLLLELFHDVEIAEDMHVSTHEALSHELLSHLTDIGSLSQSDAGKHVVKSINILMLAVLESADRTSSFHVLLKFLTKSEDPVFNKLVVKCLLKITKGLVTSIDGLNLDIIMKGLHEYFQAHPRSDIQDGRSNTVMRTVRTALNEIVKLKREGVRVYMKLIPPNSDIHYYVDNMLANLANKGTPASSPSPSSSMRGMSPTNSAAAERISAMRKSTSGSSMHSESGSVARGGDLPDDPEEQLDHIFEMLHKKETTQEALKLLYHFKQRNPDFDLSNHLSRTSSVFQAYIERGLNRVEEQEKARAGASDPSSSPTSRSSTGASPAGSIASATALAYRNRLNKLRDPEASPSRSSSGAAPSGPSVSSSQDSSDTSSSLARLRGRLQAAKSNSMSASRDPEPAPVASPSSGDADRNDALQRIRSRIQRIRNSDAE